MAWRIRCSETCIDTISLPLIVLETPAVARKQPLANNLKTSIINTPAVSVARCTLIALLGFATFSIHDALIKTLGGYSLFQIGFFAVLFSFVPFSLFIALSSKEVVLRPKLPGLVAIRCCSIFGSMVFAFYAFRSLPLSEVYALIFAAPIIITVLAIPILGESVKMYRWLAVMLGFFGVLVVLGPHHQQITMGHIAGILAACCTAVTAVITRLIGNRESSLTLIVYPLLVNLTLCGVAMVWVYQPMPGIALLTMGGIGLLAVLGQAFLIYAYRNAPAQYIAPFQYSQMVWAVLIGGLFFNEVPDRNVLLGTFIIVSSGILIVWRELAVSSNKPILNTRNFRAVSGPQAYSSETDENGQNSGRD